MATHSSILAWRILWTEEPGRLSSVGSRRGGHNWSDLAAAAAARVCICGGHETRDFVCLNVYLTGVVTHEGL